MLAREVRQDDVQASDSWVAAATKRALHVSPGFDVSVSTDPRIYCTALFDGVLYNRADLVAEVGRETRTPQSDADLVRLAYERWGKDAVEHIKGIFALIVYDGTNERLLAARDRLGAYPLFYAHVGATTFFSTDVRSLVASRGVSAELNRLALADHLCHRWPDQEETYFKAVRRVPPAHVLTLEKSGWRARRYWDPIDHGRRPAWLSEVEVEGFDQALDEAVARCLALGRAGIFLSGGFDSVSVAAVATDIARRRSLAAPLALSLAFPDPTCNEEPVQRGVARHLGLEQEMMTFAAAVGRRGLLASALEMAASWPVPMFNCWNPAYAELARVGVSQGCEVILTGNGGDEWLGVTPYLAADLLRAGDVPGLVRYLASMQRSYHASRFAIVRGGMWTFGLRPLLSAALGRMAPAAWRASRVRRLVASTPSFVAPDVELRREMDARAGANLPDPNPPEGFYLQDARTALEHPLMAIDLEETFEMGRLLGVRILHPYWDADLVGMLQQVPPQLLNLRGRSKGLVRHTIARRFPGLGFERHRKVAATSYFRQVLRDEGPAAWRAMGCARRLAEMGIVEPRELGSTLASLLAGSHPEQLYRVWDVLALESWLRSV